MTKSEIMAEVKAGRMTFTEAMEKLAAPPPKPARPAVQPAPPPVPAKAFDNTKPRERKPPRFKVAEQSGWCSVYFDGLRRPVTLPAELWEELLGEENLPRLRAFLEENRTKFRSRKRRLADAATPGAEANAAPVPVG